MTIVTEPTLTDWKPMTPELPAPAEAGAKQLGLNVDLLKRLLTVPSRSRHEDQMVAFLVDHVRRRGEERCGSIVTDEWNNVYIRKGKAGTVPCVAAHIDTVQPIRPVEVVQQNGILFGMTEGGQRTGIGADDKAGVFLCLELLERFDHIAVALFAQEEIGYNGAQNARPEFFERVGYVLEFDAPAHGLVSYTSGGVRLFQNDGAFIRTALPVLERFGCTRFQHHPFTDVKALRQRFSMSCLNLSCGYYHWHARNEYVKLADVERSLAMATAIIPALGTRRYEYDRNQPDAVEPPVSVTELQVPWDDSDDGGQTGELPLSGDIVKARENGWRFATAAANVPRIGGEKAST
jgi:tripeptide aminopeptidase